MSAPYCFYHPEFVVWNQKPDTSVLFSQDNLTLAFLLWLLQSKAMAPHSSSLAWKIPWAEEPSRLQSMGSVRVRHDWSDLAAAADFSDSHISGKQWGQSQPWWMESHCWPSSRAACWAGGEALLGHYPLPPRGLEEEGWLSVLGQVPLWVHETQQGRFTLLGLPCFLGLWQPSSGL